jgi:hypothetical protein
MSQAVSNTIILRQCVQSDYKVPVHESYKLSVCYPPLYAHIIIFPVLLDVFFNVESLESLKHSLKAVGRTSTIVRQDSTQIYIFMESFLILKSHE